MQKYVEVMAENRVGDAIIIHQKFPVPTSQGIQFPGTAGKLHGVFEDGLLLRADNGEVFFPWSDVLFVSFPSEIAMAQAMPNVTLQN